MNKKWRLSKQVRGLEQEKGRRVSNPKKDPARLAFIRTLPCAVKSHPFPGATECRGATEAHHPTGAGMGLKDDDAAAMPLCWGHHVPEFHGNKGAFFGRTKAWLKAWQRRMVGIYSAIPTR